VNESGFTKLDPDPGYKRIRMWIRLYFDANLDDSLEDSFQVK